MATPPLLGLAAQAVRAAASALGFLTTLPVPWLSQLDGDDFARANGFYPLAGLLVGLGSGGVWWLAHTAQLGLMVSAALSLITWLALTGMLHFDGLLDSADAVFATKTPAERLGILKDVHVGAFGFGVGGGALLLKFALLGEMTTWWWPAAAAICARGLVVLPMRLYPAARSTGLGASSRAGWWPLGLVLTAPVALLPHAAPALVASTITTLLVAAFCARKLGGGLTGDVYGACIELSELAALLALTSWR